MDVCLLLLYLLPLHQLMQVVDYAMEQLLQLAQDLYLDIPILGLMRLIIRLDKIQRLLPHYVPEHIM